MVINRKTKVNTSADGVLPRSSLVNFGMKWSPISRLSSVSNLHSSGVTSGTLSRLDVRKIGRIPNKVARIDAYHALIGRERKYSAATLFIKKRVAVLIRLASMYIEGLPGEVNRSYSQALQEAHSCLVRAIELGDDKLGTANYIEGKLLFEGGINDTTEKRTNLMESAERCFLVSAGKKHPGARISLEFLRLLGDKEDMGTIKEKLLCLANYSDHSASRIDMLYYVGKWITKGLLPGDIKEAESYLNEGKNVLRADNYRNIKCRMLLGWMHCKERDYSQAIEFFLGAVTLGAAGFRMLWEGLYASVKKGGGQVHYNGAIWYEKDLEGACACFGRKVATKKGDLASEFDTYNQDVLSQVFKFKKRKNFEEHFYRGKNAATFKKKVGVFEEWTLAEHVDAVLVQFDQYYAHREDLPVDASFYVGLFYLHDIGKPQACEQGDKNRQHEFTRPMIQGYFNDENLQGVDVMLALIGEDPIGEYLNPSSLHYNKPELAVANLRRLAQQAKMPIGRFYEAILIYYKCDASCYKRSVGPSIFNYKQSNRQQGMVFLDHQQACMKKLEQALGIS